MLKKSFIISILLIATASVSFADMKTENWRMNKAFFDCLQTCTDYDSNMEIRYNSDNNTESYWRAIKKVNNKCQVSFGQSSSSKNPPADAGGTAEIYQFPMRVLKKINASNFDKYAKKYYDEEHSH